ncbi:TIGR02269 family lipoprotein [Vitiosangium sp. GDMCC 1.1324]|uniref:SitA6 family polymorphic toxin lipoprotein n=1 Tax=Vitiosangium sp. (strain GDMCC 1.1324) TaxID=2138576 RepID=UPI00130EA0DC|nr:TIGR02269 family lipoprotein [Vitiosangium sp. GDMCC 1.1324]
MKTWRLWGLLLGVLLSGCAASGPSLHEEERLEATAVEAEREEADACLAFFCDEEVCGFFRCEAVAELAESGGEDEASGQVVKTRGSGAVGVYLPGAGNSPMRYWGRPQPWPQEEGAVFIIPWRNHHLRHLLPSQQKLLAEIDAKANRPHEKHHIFPQEFKAWFESKGIDIHQWTMFIETSLHKSIHRGASGGAWNAAWRQFILEKGSSYVTKEEIWKHAWELCVRFGLMAPLEPYYGKTKLPPPIEF